MYVYVRAIIDKMNTHEIGAIERISTRLGVPDPKLSSEQASLKVTRNCAQLATVIGISTGEYIS